ncbi:hypothetical protein RLEG3_16180 [Rhizobium leguminosarum bv. trifolii WSM1689]|nr:hypothetical protein RLEG3_16180 [Rhizobium leguminosarum bv. trifolii WSM1689]
MAFMEISFRPVVLLNVSNRKVFLTEEDRMKKTEREKPAKRPA